MRSVWYGRSSGRPTVGRMPSTRMTMATPTPPITATLRPGSPATTRMASVMATYTIDVPRSGWINTSVNGGSIKRAARIAMFQPVIPRRTQSATMIDRQTSIVTLPISDGCRVKNGRGIQRCDPRAAENPRTMTNRPMVLP